MNYEKPTLAQKAWTILSALALAGLVLANFINRVVPASLPVATVTQTTPMDCQNYRQVDTVTLYNVTLPQQDPTGHCEGYDCGRGFEWWGRVELPAGSWRLKVKPAGLVCLDLLTACDSVCLQASADTPYTVDWKTDVTKPYWIHFSSGIAAQVVFEVGRYEEGYECQPAYWGPPCSYDGPPSDRRK